MAKEKPEKDAFKTLKVKVEGVLPGGRKISPETLSIERFAQLFQRFKKLIESALGENRAAIKNVNFQYKKSSAALISDVPVAVHEVIQTEVRQLEAGHPADLDHPEIADTIKYFSQFAKEIGDDAKITIGTDDEDFVSVTKDTEFAQLKDTRITEETIIYGKMFTVGGKAPNIHISPMDGGETAVIAVTENEAKELAGSLYDILGLRVEVTADILSGEIHSRKYLGRVQYSRTLDEGKFRRDKEVGTRVWAGIDPVAWEKEQRGN